MKEENVLVSKEQIIEIIKAQVIQETKKMSAIKLQFIDVEWCDDGIRFKFKHDSTEQMHKV